MSQSSPLNEHIRMSSSSEYDNADFRFTLIPATAYTMFSLPRDLVAISPRSSLNFISMFCVLNLFHRLHYSLTSNPNASSSSGSGVVVVVVVGGVVVPPSGIDSPSSPSISIFGMSVSRSTMQWLKSSWHRHLYTAPTCWLESQNLIGQWPCLSQCMHISDFHATAENGKTKYTAQVSS